MPADHAIFAEPYEFQCLGPGQYNIACTSVTALPNPPAKATYAIVQVQAVALRYTTDGTTAPIAGTAPSGKGLTLAAGSSLALSGAAMLLNFRVIGPTGAQFDVEYYA